MSVVEEVVEEVSREGEMEGNFCEVAARPSSACPAGLEKRVVIIILILNSQSLHALEAFVIVETLSIKLIWEHGLFSEYLIQDSLHYRSH